MMARRRRYDDLHSRRSRRNYGPIVITVVIIGLLAVLGFWYFNPHTAPVWVRSFIPEAPVRLYKWTDADGQVQYSNTPPPAGVAFEMVDYWEDANVIPDRPLE